MVLGGQLKDETGSQWCSPQLSRRRGPPENTACTLRDLGTIDFWIFDVLLKGSTAALGPKVTLSLWGSRRFPFRKGLTAGGFLIVWGSPPPGYRTISSNILVTISFPASVCLNYCPSLDADFFLVFPEISLTFS